PWISDLTGENIEPDESGSPTIGCRFLKDAARSPSCDARKCARCGAQQATKRRLRETWVARGEWLRQIRPTRATTSLSASVDPTEARNARLFHLITERHRCSGLSG